MGAAPRSFFSIWLDKGTDATTKVQVLFYSMYGHIYRMAEAVAEGARRVPGVEVTLLQVPELVPPDVLEKSGATAAKATFAHVPVAKVVQLVEADAIICETWAIHGVYPAMAWTPDDNAIVLWAGGKLVKVDVAKATSSATQHGGQESTILSFHTTLLHHGFVIVGVPYSEARLTEMNEISGGSPYGASTLTRGDGSRLPSENELAIARFQGRHVATIAAQLKRGRG